MATILLVDDSAISRSCLAAVLGQAGHRLLEAGDGAAALACARSEGPDLVISDILMPTMDGYEFVRRLRADPALARIPVIFCTAYCHEEEALALARACGVSQVLAKPSAPEDVLRAVDDALRGDAPVIAPATAEALERAHLRLLTDSLSRKADKLQKANERLEQEVLERRKAEQRLNVQSVVALILANSSALRNTAPRILQSVCEFMDWECGVLWRVAAHDQVLRCEEIWHVASAPFEKFAAFCRQRSFASGIALPGRVWAKGEPIWVPDITLIPNCPRAAAAAQDQMQSAFGFPVRRGSETLGVMEFFSRKARAPDHDVMQMMATIGSQVGQFIERTRAEEALLEREELYRLLTENSNDLIYLLDVAGNIVYASPSIHRLGGVEVSRVLGTAALASIHPEDAAAVREAWGRIRAGESVSLTFRLQHADGNWRWIEALVSPVQYRGQQHVMAVGRDLTERIQLEDQFRQAQKMEAVGRLAGGVAHDFNNLLTVIIGYSEVLKAAAGVDDPTRPMIDEIGKAGERAASLTRQLLAFSRKQLLLPMVFDLGALVKNMQKMLSRLIGEDLQLDFNLQPGALNIKADPGQMEQVIMNLVLNSRDAMPRGGKLTVATAEVELDAAYAQTHAGIQPGSYAALTVTDTGCGMDTATQARIFEPFFTTKGPEKGTGLGLAMVFGIVQQSGGSIDVSSAMGVGTTFTIFLPRAFEELHRPKARSIHNGSRRGGETILVAEDDDGIRSLTRFILEGNGYKVLEGSNGLQALAICLKHEGAIDILVSDVVMPNMSGPELVRQAFSMRRTMKVLYLSGYTDDAIVRHGMIDADTPYLQKPFTPHGLLAKVRDVLDTAAPVSSM